MAKKTCKKVANSLIKELNKHNVGAYIYHTATTGSVYIRFANPKLCSIRIGDHDGREKYRYKFNLRKDIQKAVWKNEDGIWRFYCPFDSPHLIIEQVLKRKEISKDWNNTYEYVTPSFKKFEAQ